MLAITDTQTYALVIRDSFFDALKGDSFFVGYTCRRTPMNSVQPESLPYLGVYLADEPMGPDGDPAQGPPKFIHDLKIAFSVLIANNDMDAAEATIDAAWSRILHRLFDDPTIMNVWLSSLPDNVRIEGIPRCSRRHAFGATQLNQQTPIAELRSEITVRFRTLWPPIIPDDLLEIDVTTGVKPGDTADEMAKRRQVHVTYEFEGTPTEPPPEPTTEEPSYYWLGF